MQRFVASFCLVLGLGLGAACAPENDGSNGKVDDGGLPGANDAQSPDTQAPEAGTDATHMPQPNEPLLPLKEGNSWTYKVTGAEGVVTKVTTVGALEPVGGTGPHATKLAHKVVTRKGEADETISWQLLEGNKVVRFREQAFNATTKQLDLEEHWDPAKLRVDWSAEHLVADARWVERYAETKTAPGQPPQTNSNAVDSWSVDAVDSTVKVPAGEFKAIVLVKVGGTSQKTYWFVPGVGKVKETGGQTEELVDFQVSP